MGTEERTTIEIDASREQVWAVLRDVERWPEWTASMRGVKLLDDELRVGARVLVEQPRLPRTTWTVTRLDVTGGFDWEARGLGTHTVGSHGVESVGPDRSRVTLAITQQGPIGSLVGRLYRSLTRRYVAMEAAGLKARCESHRS